MTDRGQLSQHVRTVFDRLAWGLGDLVRTLAERGAWPAVARGVISQDGRRWTVVGTRLEVARASRSTADGLLVRESDCLWGAVQLPDMPRRALEGAVAEALWRVSPLPTGQIVAAWHAQPDAKAGWTVEWGICKRSLLAEALTAQGLSAEAPIYLARMGRAVAVRDSAWLKHQRRVNGMAVGLLVLTLAAVSVPALIPLALERQRVVHALRHVSGLEPQAAPLRKQLDELRSQSMLADELRQSAAPALPLGSVVEELSAALPNDAWLDRIEINGNEIRITGLATNATELIGHLGRQPAFAEVRATTASVRDNAQNKERFTFEMRWREKGGKS